MHEYMTRHMVALQAFPYANQDLRAGDAFLATPDDATYLTKHGRAREVTKGEMKPAAPAPASAPAPVAEVVSGNPGPLVLGTGMLTSAPPAEPTSEPTPKAASATKEPGVPAVDASAEGSVADEKPADPMPAPGSYSSRRPHNRRT